MAGVAEASTFKKVSPAAFPNVRFFSSATCAVIPPAAATSEIAKSLSPLVFLTLIFSLAAVAEASTFKKVSPAAFPNVKFFSSATCAVIPPAVATSDMARSVSPCVLVTTIVSAVPPPVPDGVVKEIALANPVLSASAFEIIVTCPPAIFTSLPWEASISTPPAVAVNAIAFSAVPSSFTTLIVCAVPASAWSLIASATLTKVLILTLPETSSAFAEVSVLSETSFITVEAPVVPEPWISTIVKAFVDEVLALNTLPVLIESALTSKTLPVVSVLASMSITLPVVRFVAEISITLPATCPEEISITLDCTELPCCCK